MASEFVDVHVANNFVDFSIESAPYEYAPSFGFFDFMFPSAVAENGSLLPVAQ